MGPVLGAHGMRRVARDIRLRLSSSEGGGAQGPDSTHGKAIPSRHLDDTGELSGIVPLPVDEIVG